MPLTQNPLDGSRRLSATHDPGDNTSAVVTVTPASGEHAHVDWMCVSYDAIPQTADTITVFIGGTEVFRWRPGDLGTVQGPRFVGPWIGEVDEVIVCTATASGAGDKSTMSIGYRANAVIT